MPEFVLLPKWQSRPSPNRNKRPDGVRITAIVLHADASDRVDTSLDWCRRPESKVSYHFLIGRTGNVFLLVHPEQRAWHCGVSEMDGVADVNDFSIGVCLSNKNDGEAFPAAQVFEAATLCAALCKHYGIPLDRITTHAETALPAGRKTDPKGFDMEKFKATINALSNRRV
jgi:N-acetylmuramoyl-L-alanine amidase